MSESVNDHQYVRFVDVKKSYDQRSLVVKNFNLDIDFMQGKMPTAEVIAMEFWKILEPQIIPYNAQLHKIVLAETHNNIIEYYG